MRALPLVLLALGCASPLAARLSVVEARAARTEVLREAVCIRFEEYQVARDGRVTHPCHEQAGRAGLIPQVIFGKGE